MPDNALHKHTILYRYVRRIARVGVFFFAFLAFLSAAVIGLTQLPSFRAWMIAKGLEAVNGQLQGKLTVSDITGNFLTGLELHNVKLTAGNTTLIEAPLVDFNYQLRPIFEGKVIGARVIVYNPKVNLVRNAIDSTWNYDRLTKPAKDTVKTPFNMEIDVQEFELVDAMASLNDLTVKPAYDSIARNVDYSHLDLQHLNLSAQAHVAPTKESVLIEALSFEAPRPDVKLVEFTANIALDTSGITLRGVRLETTRTLLSLDGRIDSVNFIGAGTAIRSWESFPITLAVDAQRLSAMELKRFVPAAGFMDGTPVFKLFAHGSFSDLLVDQFTLDLNHTHLDLAARLQNINLPDKLFIETKLTDSWLENADTRAYVPGLHVPDFGYLGKVAIKSASFSGTPDNFTAITDLTTAIGAARGGARLDLRGKVMKYTADLALVHANFAPVLKDPSMASDFTGRAVVNGSGTTLRDLDARVRLESQGSVVAGHNYRMVYFDGAIRNGGVVTIDTLLAAFGGHASNAGMEGQANLDQLPRVLNGNMETLMGSQLTLSGEARSVFASSPLFAASGVVDLRSTANPIYKLNAMARDLNLADILNDPAYTSNLNLRATVSANNTDPDLMEGTARVVLGPSIVSGQNIPATTALLTLKRIGARDRSLDLMSDFADAHVTGTWSFQTLASSAGKGINSLIDYVSRKAGYKPDRTAVITTTALTESINAQYDINFKDLMPLGALIKAKKLDAKGALKGTITGNASSLGLTSEGTLQHFGYEAGTTSLNIEATKIAINLKNLTPQGIGATTTADIDVRSDSIVQFGTTTLNVPNMLMTLREGVINLRGATAINNQTSIAVDGRVDVNNPNGYDVTLDTLLVGLPSMNMSIRNVGNVHIVAGSNEVRIDSFTVQRNNAEIISITGGLINGERLDNVQVRLVKATLGDLAGFIQGNGAGSATVRGAVRQGLITINGTLNSPVVDVALNLDSVNYNSTVVGNFAANFHYENENVAGNAVLANIGSPLSDTALHNQPALIQVNSFPINLAMNATGSRLIEGRPVDISVITNGLQLAAVSPFIPAVDVRGGTADMKFNITGTLPDITYAGTAQLKQVRAVLLANGVQYYTNAALTFQNSTLTINKMIIQNDPRELVGSGANITGTIGFAGLTPNEFDIRADVQRLLVLSNASQAISPTLYGDLVVRTGARPFTLTGTMQAPVLTADVVVLNGNLQMEESEASLTGNGSVRYIDIRDWQKLTERQYGPDLPLLTDSASVATSAGTGRQLDSNVRRGSLKAANNTMKHLLDSVRQVTTAESGASFADAMTYDLSIGIDGNVGFRYRISTIEELRADIGLENNEPLQYTQNPGEQPQLTGGLEIKQGSEYTFIKRFAATGSITFRGDVSNPLIAITAIYSGRRILDAGDPQEYTVRLNVQGSPKTRWDLKMAYSIAGGPEADAQTDEVKRDAMSLLLFGRTTQELKGSGLGNHIGNLASSVLGSSAGSVGSSALTSAFAGSFVQSFDVDFAGNQLNHTRLNVVSQFGKITVRYGGEVADPSKGILTIELPLVAVTNVDWLRNFTVQLQHEVQDFQNAAFSQGSVTRTETTSFQLEYQVNF